MDLDDIEDIVKPGDLKPSDRYSNKKNVVLRVRRKNNKVDGNENEIQENGEHQSVSDLIKPLIQLIINFPSRSSAEHKQFMSKLGDAHIIIPTVNIWPVN